MGRSPQSKRFSNGLEEGRERPPPDGSESAEPCRPPHPLVFVWAADRTRVEVRQWSSRSLVELKEPRPSEQDNRVQQRLVWHTRAGVGSYRHQQGCRDGRRRSVGAWAAGRCNHFYTRDALKARKPGPAGTCTLGKVAFFYDSTGNPIPGGGQRSVTKWVAVAQDVAAAKGRGEVLDPVTCHPVMRLQNRLSFFLAETSRRTVHLYHRCPDGKCGPCPEEGKGNV